MNCQKQTKKKINIFRRNMESESGTETNQKTHRQNQHQGEANWSDQKEINDGGAEHQTEQKGITGQQKKNKCADAKRLDILKRFVEPKLSIT